ncbi:hypothetical protein C8J57DRAFT_1572102 [Mycena rebaudengoi]|nr:hypothetical protein C8J57DRAFT_1572102 [Mycena rebaudengoi]
MEPVSPIESCDSSSLSPSAQRAQLEKVQREISMRESDIALLQANRQSDIALLEANHRQKIAQLDATHREYTALLEAKQRDLAKEQRLLQSALARVVFPVLTLPTEIREIALETSELWASVYIKPLETHQNPPRDFLDARLRRAKGFPLSLYLHSYPALVPSPSALLQTYSFQLRHLSLTLSLADVLDLQLNFRATADEVAIFEDLPALLELTLEKHISITNLGIYPTLTSLITSDTSVAELHRLLRTCPHLVEIVVKGYMSARDDAVPHSLITHSNLESLIIWDTGTDDFLDCLVLPNLRKLVADDIQSETLIAFLTRSSCSLRYLELFGNGMTDDEWQRFLELLPSLDTLIIDNGDPFFAAASRPLILPLVRNLKIETDTDFEFPYAAFAQFLASRKDAVVPLRSLQLNVILDESPSGIVEYTAGIGAVFAQGAEMSEEDTRSGYALQWRYGEKFPDDEKWAHTGLHDGRTSRSSQIYCGEEAVTAALMLERAAASLNLPTAAEARYVGHAEVAASRRAGGQRWAQCVIRRAGTMRNGWDRDVLEGLRRQVSSRFKF